MTPVLEYMQNRYWPPSRIQTIWSVPVQYSKENMPTLSEPEYGRIFQEITINVLYNVNVTEAKLYRHTNFSAISRISLKYLITGLNFSWMSHMKNMAFSGFIFPSLSDCEAIFYTRMQTLWHHENASIA